MLSSGTYCQLYIDELHAYILHYTDKKATHGLHNEAIIEGRQAGTQMPTRMIHVKKACWSP